VAGEFVIAAWKR